MSDFLHNHLQFFMVTLILGMPILLVLWVIPMGIVCKKAGFSPWLTMLNCFPLGPIALVYLLALADWKDSRRPRIAETAQEAPRLLRSSGPQLVVRPVATRLAASGSGGMRAC